MTQLSEEKPRATAAKGLAVHREAGLLSPQLKAQWVLPMKEKRVTQLGRNGRALEFGIKR